MTETIERNTTASDVKSDATTVPHEQARQPKLFDQVRERIRVLHYSYSTEKTYLYWIKFFILHNNKRHPRDMGAPEVEAFLSHLATQREVSAGTQNQAMHAILFLYKQVAASDEAGGQQGAGMVAGRDGKNEASAWYTAGKVMGAINHAPTTSTLPQHPQTNPRRYPA